MEKAQLRECIRRQRRELAPQWVERQSLRIAGRVFALPEFAQARSVACYLALPAEVQTAGILERCWKDAKRVHVPALQRQQGRYALAEMAAGEALARGPLGVPEPAQPRWTAEGEVDLALVPGVAFDARGGRVGHGGGHYDRLLRALGVAAGRQGLVAVGLAFEFQVFDRVPVAENDVRVDAVVTEDRLILPLQAGEQGERRQA